MPSGEPQARDVPLWGVCLAGGVVACCNVSARAWRLADPLRTLGREQIEFLFHDAMISTHNECHELANRRCIDRKVWSLDVILVLKTSCLHKTSLRESTRLD